MPNKPFFVCFIVYIITREVSHKKDFQKEK